MSHDTDAGVIFRTSAMKRSLSVKQDKRLTAPSSDWYRREVPRPS